MDIHSILFTDEAAFPLHVAENQQFWATCNPRRCSVSRIQHGANLMVWAGLTGQRIVRPFCFFGNVNASSYKEILENCAIPELEAAGLLSTV
ncbi:unnamed protein product [Dicrocoelium dendriticum]|nr:unnamed protein product [Dicrocoelium dendriticum]